MNDPSAGIGGPTPDVIVVRDADLEGVIQAGPGRSRVLWVGIGMLAAVIAVRFAQAVRLPHDGIYGMVLYLMWSANLEQTWIPEYLTIVIHSLAAAVPVTLISWAIVWPCPPAPRARAAIGWVYRFALYWPLLLALSTVTGRMVANVVYAMPSWPSGDLMIVLARVEGPFLEWIQSRYGHPLADAFFAAVYSWVWVIGLLGFGPWLVLRERGPAASQLIVGTVLAALLAVPFFLLLPVFDPWATNPLYGYGSEGRTAVRYLYPGPDLAALTEIATRGRWATGSCLPSLHVAFPLVYALIAAGQRMRLAAWLFGGLTVATGVAVVYLGRHWVIDVVAAVPFAIAVHWLVRRIDPRFTLSPDSGLRKSA